MMNAIMKFIRDEEGLTIVEYAVAGTLITLGVVTAFTDLGDAVATQLGELEDAMTGAAAAP